MKNRDLQLNRVNNILDFFKKGKSLEGISVLDKSEKLFKIMGTPVSIIGDKKWGYYRYAGGLQYGYTKDHIDEVGIVFDGNKRTKFPVKVDLLEENYITNKTSICSLIKLLSYSKIKWRSWDENSTSAFSIRTEGDVLILFHLDEETLEKIVYLGHYDLKTYRGT